MAIKIINSVQPSQRRPLQVSDLQDIWDGIDQIFGAQYAEKEEPKILFGFDDMGNGRFSPGVYAQNGELYLCDESYQYDTVLYSHLYPDDNRTLENGDVIPFSFNRVLDNSGENGVEAFEASREKILELKANAYANNSVPWSALMGGIPNDKIANNSIPFEKMFGVITPEKMQNSSKNVRIAYGRTTLLDSVGTYNLPISVLNSNNCIFVQDCNAQSDITFSRISANSTACQGFFRVNNISDEDIRITVPTFSQTTGAPIVGSSRVTIEAGKAKLFFFASDTDGAGYIYVVGAIDAL